MNTSAKGLSHDELQHLEHANKILREHLELLEKITVESSEYLNAHLSSLHTYVAAIGTIQRELGESVSNILKSARELGGVTNRTKELMDFGRAVGVLEETLTSEVLDKLSRIVK